MTLSRNKIVLFGASLFTLALMLIYYDGAMAQPAGSDVVSSCDNYSGIVHKMAGCIREAIESTVQEYFTNFYPLVARAINATMILAVIYFGVQLLSGSIEKVSRDSMIFAIKIAAVVMFTNSSSQVYNTIVGAMDGMAAAAVTYTPSSEVVAHDLETGEADPTRQMRCMQKLIEEQGRSTVTIRGGRTFYPVLTPWVGFDCLLDGIFGTRGAVEDGAIPQYNVDPNYPNLPDSHGGASRGLIFFFFSSLQSSVAGLALAAMGFIFMYSLIFMVIRIFFAYIMAYIGIAFLVILSPLIVPLILFKATKQYFDKWAKMLISMAVQPVIMMVFLIFSITAVDLTVFSGNFSVVYRIAGDASKQDGFLLNTYLTIPRHPDGSIDDGSSGSVVGTPIVSKEDRSLLRIKAGEPRDKEGNLITTKVAVQKGVAQINVSLCTEKNKKDDEAIAKACNLAYDVKTKVENIDWVLMAKARTPAIEVSDEEIAAITDTTASEEEKRDMVAGRTIFNEVMSTVFFACMVMFILNGLMGIIPRVATDLVGDLHQSPSVTSGIMNQIGAGVAPGATGAMRR